MSIFSKYKYFSSFEAGNCVSNSSFKWMKKSRTIQQHKGIHTRHLCDGRWAEQILEQIGRFGKWTPIHEASNAILSTDTNYGTYCSLWDKTLYTTPSASVINAKCGAGAWSYSNIVKKNTKKTTFFYVLRGQSHKSWSHFSTACTMSLMTIFIVHMPICECKPLHICKYKHKHICECKDLHICERNICKREHLHIYKRRHL